MRAWSLGNFFSSFAVPAGLQKRLVSFLLQRAIGHFLEDNLDLEKLDIELSNGIVHLTDLKLNTGVFNDLVAGTPLAVTKGSIGAITATIPWRNLWSGQCVLEIDGIDITLAPVQAQPSHLQDLEEQILSSSVNLANDFLHQKSTQQEEALLQESLLQTFHAAQTPSGFPGDFNSRPAAAQASSDSSNLHQEADGTGEPTEGEGIQLVAKLIEKLMARIQIICRSTVVRLRHTSSLSMVGVAAGNTKIPAEQKDATYEVVINLPYIAYRDETPGWDQPTSAMEASSTHSSTSRSTSSSVTGSMMEDSVIPSVIWQDSPESIKTVTFKGFSVWIKQKDDSAQVLPSASQGKVSATPDIRIQAVHEDDMSDSDADEFSDAQENLTPSMMASQVIDPSRDLPRPISPVTSGSKDTSPDLYEAEIISSLQHKNRVKVNIRKHTTMTTGTATTPASTSSRSLLDIDFHLKAIFVAISPGQLGFLMEILALMENAPPADKPPVSSFKQQDGDQDRLRVERKDSVGHPAQDIPLRDEPAHQGPQVRTDNLFDRQGSLSPIRTHQADLLRAVHSRSPGGRPVEHDRQHGANTRGAIPTPTAFMDSSRFLNGSTYSDQRASAATPSLSTTSSSISPALTIKLKARIATFQIFVLYQDPKTYRNIPTEAGFFKNPTPEALKANHLKVELDSMVLRYQQWAPTSSGGAGSKSQRVSKGQVDLALNNFAVSEWIESAPRVFDPRVWEAKAQQYRVPPRKQYIPMLEFDPEQDAMLQGNTGSKFSTLQVPERYLTERARNLRTKKNKSEPRILNEALQPVLPAGSVGSERSRGQPGVSSVNKEVVRMRILLGGKRDGSRPNTPSGDTSASGGSSIGYSQDVTIEVKPLQVHVDLFTFQRMEQCLISLIGPEKKAKEPAEVLGETKSRTQRQMEQQIMDDLEGAPKAIKPKTRLRLRLNAVQLWVSVPDMAILLTGQEDNGPEFRSIYDVLAVNISKLVITRASDLTIGSSPAAEGFDQRALHGAEDLSSKLKIDISNVSAFVIPAHESSSRAVLSIGSLPNHPSNMSGYSSSIPNVEITTRPAKSLPVRYQRQGASGFPRPPVSHAFAILENEENVHNPADEEEELLLFKQRTIETSLLVVNTHFPLVAVHLEKRILDIFQLRANDIGTWITLFSERLSVLTAAAFLSNAGNETISPDHGATLHPRFDISDVREDRCEVGGFKDDQSEHGTDQSTAYGEELRYQAGGGPKAPHSGEFHLQTSMIKPTAVSVLVYAQSVEVVLDYPTAPTVLDPVPIVKSYQINAGEARIFTAVKYQGGNETYLSVDAEDLEFWEVTAQKPKAMLLTRTIPKTVKLKSPKPMFHMTSVLSFDPVLKFKENDTNLAFSGISWKFTTDQTGVDDVQDFFAEPVGIVYLNPPHQCTRVNVSLSECGLDYKPLHIPSRFVLSFEKMKVFATLIPESPTLKSKVQIYNMNLFLIDHSQSILTPQHPSIGSSLPGIDAQQFWKSLGFAPIGQCPFFELNSVKSKNGQLPLYDLSITNHMFYLDTCSDSFDTLVSFLGYMGENGDMPQEKKDILARLAEAEQAENRAKSNVIYQDVLASLDEDAFRKPKPDNELDDPGTLDFVEGFYSVEKEDSENDLFKAQMRESPNVDGFHEVYADLLAESQKSESSASDKRSGKGKNPSKSKTHSKASSSSKDSLELDKQLRALDLSNPTVPAKKLRDDRDPKANFNRPRSHSRKETLGHLEDILRVLDSEAEFVVQENYFSIPILTQEERARDEGSLAKMRLRVRDFNFSWRLFDGLDWEISRLDEAERKKQARQLANRLYDPNDVIHSTMDSAQSNLEASIFERLSGMQPSTADRQGQYRRDLSPTSSEADSASDYQNDMMSQGSGRPSSTSSRSGRQSQKSHSIGQESLTSPGHTHGHGHASSSAQRRKKKLERSKTAMIEFNADKVRLDFEDYVAGVETASHLSVRVRQFEIIDNLKSSLWHKFLSHQRPDSNTATPRLTQSNMIRIDLDGVRPVLGASTVEYRLKVKILPLRLYIDQDALIFLIHYMVQGGGPAAEDSVEAEKATQQQQQKSGKKKSNDLYFQSVRLGELSLKMDYKPKHVDYTGLSGGNFVELMNFFHLDAAEMTLQEVHLHGISGFAKLGQDLISSWLPHIRSTQVPHMVSGLTPIRSLVNLGSGIADLVLLPIEQYKRDGHIIRGLQKGGQAFTRATTLEALKIGTKLAVGTQVLLEHADEIFGSGAGTRIARVAGDDGEEGMDRNGKRVVATMVSDSEAYMQESIDDEDQLLQHLQYQQQQQQLHHQQQALLGSGQGVSSSSSGSKVSNKVSKYANQPADINEGMELAYKSLSKNIGTAAHTIFAVPMEVYERAGAHGSVRAVIRAVPVAVLKPMIGATEAFSKVLIGIRNSIDPAQRLQMEDKYKRH